MSGEYYKTIFVSQGVEKIGKNLAFLEPLMEIGILLTQDLRPLKEAFLTIFRVTPQNKNGSQVLPRHGDEPWIPVFSFFLDFPASEILTVNRKSDKGLSQ